MSFEIINTTYYDSDDLQAIIESVFSTGGYQVRDIKKIRVKYLGKATEYHEDSVGRSYRSEGHQFSLQSKGWGEILQLGERPRAAASYPRGRYGGREQIVLSIARKTSIFGEDPIQKLAGEGIEGEVPEVAVQHVAFSIYSLLNHGTVSGWDGCWKKVPRLLRFGKKDKADVLRSEVMLAEKAAEQSQSEVNTAGWHLRWARGQVERYEKELKEAEEAHQKVEARLEDAKRNLFDYQAQQIKKKLGSITEEE